MDFSFVGTDISVVGTPHDRCFSGERDGGTAFALVSVKKFTAERGEKDERRSSHGDG